MPYFLGPKYQETPDDEEKESRFELGPPVKKKKGVLARIGDALQAGSSPGKEFAERQKQREAEDLTKPVEATNPQAQRGPMVEDLQMARQGKAQPDPGVAELKQARQAEAAIPAEPAPPAAEIPGPEVLEPTGIPPEFQPPPRPEQAFDPRNINPTTGAPYSDEEWVKKSYADDAKLKQFRRENNLPEDFSPEDYAQLKRKESAQAAKDWWQRTRASINKYFEDNPVTEDDLILGLRNAKQAEKKAKEIEVERENMVQKGLLKPDDDVDMEAGEAVSGQVEGAQGIPVEQLAVDPETGERVERDLTGDEDKGFVNQFVGRAVPGTVTNYNNLKGAVYRTNFLLGVAHDSNQRKTIDSVLNQLATAAHPGDPQKQEAYKVRAGQEISDLWEAGAPVHRFFNEQAAKVGVKLREDPMALVEFSQPPKNMDQLRARSGKRQLEVEKQLKDFYTNNPEYQLPSDWNQLTDIQREIKYPGIFWGENVFGNALNSVASIGTYMATAAVTRNHAAAALLAGSVLYPQFVDEIAQEIDAMEREEGIKVPDELKAQLSLLMGIPSAMAEGLGERIGFGPALTKKFSKQYTKKALKNHIVKLIKENAASKKAWQYAGKPGVWMGKQYMAGGVEEGTQQALANAAAQIAGSERSLMKGVKRAAYVGGPIEAVLAGAGKATAVTAGKAKEYMVKKKVERGKKQLDRLIKDYEDQTAEDVLMDDDLAAEESADRETYEGDLSLAAEEAAAEFTPAELEAAGKEKPADKVADFTVETEDAGPVDVTVTRRADGTVTLIPRQEGMSPIDHNADFAKGKSAPEIIAYSLEPLGVKKINVVETPAAAPKIEKAKKPTRAPMPTTAKARMGEGKAAQVGRIWGKPELVGGKRKAPTRTEPPWKKPPAPKKAQIEQVKEIWKGKRAPRPGGIIEEISIPPAKTRVTPTTKRKVFDALAKKMGDQAGAKVRFDNVIYQDERPIGLQMTVTSGPAKGATFTISDRAHKTIPRAQEFLDTIIMAYAKEGPAPGGPQKQLDALIKSLTPDQRASVLDLIKDPKMKPKEKLGLIQADLATLGQKQKLKKEVKPARIETVKPLESTGKGEKGARKKAAAAPAVKIVEAAEPETYQEAQAAIDEMKAELAGEGMGEDMQAVWPPLKELEALRDSFGVPAREPRGGGRKAPVRTVPSGVPAKKKDITQAIIERYGEKGAGAGDKGIMTQLRENAGEKAWDSMTEAEQLAETRARIKDDIAGIPDDLERTGQSMEDYLIDRAIDPLDPMNEFYAELLRRQGWEVEAGVGTGPPPQRRIAPRGGGRRAPIRTMPSGLPPKKTVVPEGGPRVAPVRTVESGLPVPKEVTNYYSGASRISDMRGHIAAGVPIGIEIAELSKNGEKVLIQYLKDGGQVFIDSGAFGAFMKGNEVNWPAVLKNYLRIAKAAGDGAKNLVVVAPDVIGDPQKSYGIADKYRTEVNEIAALGTRVILPVHRPGEDYKPGLRGVWSSMESIMDEGNRGRAIAGFPSNKHPIQIAEYEDIFKAERPPKTVHLLGISPKKKDFQDRVDELRRLDPKVEIIADANRLRSQAGRTLKPEIYSARAAKKANEGLIATLEDYQDLITEYTARTGDEYMELPGVLSEDDIRAIAKDQKMPDGFVDEFITRVESGALGEAVNAAIQQGEWAIEEDLDFKVFHDILSLSEDQIRPEMDRVDMVRRAVEWEKEKAAAATKPLESTGTGEKGARKKAKKDTEAEAEAPAEDDIIAKYRVYEQELAKKIEEHGNLDAAETHALAASGLLQEGVAAARGRLGITVSMKPGTPLMAREQKQAKNAGIEIGEIEQAIQTARDTIAQVKQPTIDGKPAVKGGLNQGALDELIDLHNRGDVYALRDIIKMTADAKDDIAKEGTVVTAEYFEGHLPSMPTYKKEGNVWYRWDGSTKWIRLTTRAKNPWFNLNDVKANLENGNLTKTTEDRAQAPPEAPPVDIETELENMSDEEIDKMLDETGEEEPAAPKAELKPGDTTAYKGYLITASLTSGEFIVSKDNARIINTKSLADAKTEIDNLTGAEKPTKGPKAPPKERAPRKAKEPKPAKPLSEIIQEGAAEGLAGAEDALSGLYDLFGGTTKLSMGVTFDEDTYAKAKPKFQSAYEHMKSAGKSLKEFFNFFVERFGNGIKPYLRRFIQETKAAIAAAKKALGNFQNVGYVYDPEDLARGIQGKPPKTQIKIIGDKMAPANIWNIDFPEGASYGLPRVRNAAKKMFATFKDYVEREASLGRHSYRSEKKWENRVQNWLDAGHEISELQDLATAYGKHMEKVVNTFSNKLTILDAIGDLQALFIPPGVMVDGVYPEFYDIDKALLNAELWNQEFIVNRYQKTLYEFLTERWQKYLAQENDILLSEIDIHNREKNKEVIRTGLPDYRKGQPLTKTEDLKDPFGFSGVGFGTAGWIDQAERHRVVNAAFDAFKDLAAVIQTGTDKAMGLANGLAIQFANLGHKARGAAAAYFPDLRTINFTRDNGDGTLAHEWSHGFHRQAPSDVETKLESLIDAFMNWYDWEAGPRLADEIMDPESGFMKRLVLKKGQTRLDFIKEEVSRRYEDAVKKRTNYYKTALALDPEYTARRSEMWARAFEAWVYDTLPGTNNYLVNDFVEAGRIGGAGVVGSQLVYPAGQEREDFAEMISHFLDGVQWDADGNQSMKDNYVDFETMQAERLKQEKQALMDQIEDRYKAIWSSEQSPDGYYWYRYDATGLGPMMQPDGYSAYDKSYKEEGQGGAGAVGYLTMLHPDDIIGYKLTNFIYDGDTATYIQEGAQDESELGETGEDALDEIPTRPGQGVGEAGEVEPGDQGERGESGGGDGRPGKERGETDGGEGDSDTGAYPATPGNYRITDESLNSASNVNDRFNANLAALKVLNQVEAEQRSATQKEKDILAGYTGWGGMSELFAWSPKDAWAVRAELVRAEMTDEELSDAEKSSVSSYYTPVPVARFMWKLAQRLGFTGGQVLDPAFGANGVFTGTMPDELAESVSVQGVEKDGLSSRIARALYEKASIEHQGFEDSKKPLNRYNLTITNVPFANYSPSDTKHNKAGHKLHNYYLNKMLDLTSPGGLAMAITTSNTMDKGGGHLQEFSQKAEFVGAIRLPSAIYSATGVVTDILVFRKNIEGSEFKGIEPDIWTAQAVDEGNDIIYNDYFIKHPDMIAGSLEKVQDRWGADKLRVVKIDDNIARTLAEKAAAFPVGIVETEVVKADLSLDDIISAPGTVKEGGLYLNDKDQVSEKVDGQEEVWPNTTPAEMRANKLGRQYIKILDQVRATLRAQKQNLPEAEIKAEQKELKKAYNQFVKKFGPLNDPKNLKIYVSLTDAAWVTTLETYDPDTEKVTKLADLFTKKIVGTEKRPDFANTDHDALSMALDEFGYPNLDYMAKLRGTDPDTVLKGVLDKVIENPETGILETMDEYLAGNVRRKLKVARSMAADNPEYERNVKLLEAALPDDIPAHRITARIGASWLKGSHISDFIKEKLKIGSELRPVLELNPFTGIWNLTFNGPRYGGSKAQTRRDIEKYKTSVEAKSVWGTPRASFFKLMADALAGKVPVVTYKVDKKVYVDEVATAGAVAKLQEIQAEFNRWLFADPARAEEAQVRFNDIVNTSTRSHYDGAHLTFPGKSMEVLTAAEAKELGVDDKMVFYDHQVNAVWQYLRNGNLYLAHEVGAGKTLTMAMIGMEAKRLKGKKKVLYVTLNDSTMGQAVEEIKRLYPLANVMPIQVSTVKERARKQLQKMALNDFDIAIMRQQDLNRIALSPEAEKTFIDEELMELREVLEEAKAAGSRIIEQDIQGRILALEAKLKAPGTFAEAKEAQEIYFDDIGVDLMIVDEAHAYKNIPFSTSLNRITGLNPAGSKTAQAFFRKAQWLNATQAKKDGIVLASGTPLTNSIAEFYNLQRALQPDEAKRQGQWRFDRWIANYGDIGAQLEWDGAGQKFKTVTTNRRIVNAGRLLATAFQNIDSVRAEDTDIARPVVYGGKPIGMTIQPNKYVIDYFENVVRDRVEAIEQDPKNAEYEGRPDNMLRIISNMSMVAIDQRLLNSKKWDPKTDTWIPAPGPYANTKMQKDSKIYVASRKIFERWKAEKKDKGVQLVFADMGVPGRYLKAFKYKTDEQIENMSDEKRQEYEDDLFAFENSGLGFNTYDGLKDELIKLGIPKNQIAFIHDADHSNKEKKAINLRRLFKKVNAGEVRVLIGSTTKAGTGVNVQKRVSDIHHLDVWWNYSAWEQRNGRGIRSGNIYTDKDGVRIFNYITEKSVDAHRWGKIFQKGKVLHSALSGDINIDVIEDISEEVMSAKEMEADASGNPLLRKQSELMDLVRTLGLERSSFLNTVRDAKNQLVAMPTRIETLESRIATQEKSKAIMEPITAVRFTGSDDILVLKKDGKKIADSLAAAVEKTRPVKDGKWWDKEKSEPTLVFGAHEEVEVERPVLDKEGNEQKDKDGKTKTKTVKEYKFKPVKAQALIESAAGDRARRWLTLKNGVTSNSYGLADWSDALGEKKASPPEIHGNVSRSVTNFIATLDKIIGEAQDEIKDLNGKKPSLEEVAVSKWPKEDEYAQAEKDLADIEAQMSATPGMSVEDARPIRDYKAPVPVLEDFAEKDKWKTRGGYIWPKQEQYNTDPPAFMVRQDSFDLKTFFGEQRKKFDPEYAYTSPAPASLFEADPGPEVNPPQEYTIEPAAEVEAVDKGGGYWDIIDAKTNQVLYEVADADTAEDAHRIFKGTRYAPQAATKFWIKSGNDFYSIAPELWLMVERIAGPGTWHLGKDEAGENHIVHRDTDGTNDIIAEVRYEPEPPAAIKGEAGAPAPRAKKFAPANPQTVDQVKTVVDAVRVKWAKGAPGVKVYRTQEGLPQDVKAYLKANYKSAGLIAGAYYNNTIYLIAENIGSNAEAVTTIFHEAFGHHGIRGTLGNKIYPVLRDLYIAKKREIDAIGETLGLDMKSTEGRAQAAEEWFAGQAQQEIESKWFDRLVRAIRQWIRATGIKLKLSDAEIRALVANARQFVKAGKRVEPIAGAAPAFRAKKTPPGKGKRIPYKHILTPEQAKRMEAAKGVRKGTFKEAAAEKLEDIKKQRQHFPDLTEVEDPALRAQFADILRTHQEMPEVVKQKTAEVMRGFIQNLGTDGYNIYSMNIILADMMRDIESGLLSDALLDKKETLPFGFSSVHEVELAYTKFKNLAEEHTEIRDALAKRKQYIGRLVDGLIKHKVLKKEVGKYNDYYHHQVLKYWGTKDQKKANVATGSADVRKHWRPWMVARKGSLLDYNTEYIEAEFVALSQQLGQLETARVLERLRKKADIKPELHADATAKNFKRFYEEAAKKISADLKMPVTAEQVMADKEMDPLYPYRKKIGMARGALEGMAAKGELEAIDSEFDDVVQSLAQSFENKKDPENYNAPDEIPDGKWFDFLAYLVRTSKPGANWAATIFKNIHARKNQIRTDLGKKFLTWQNLIPEGYVEWKPEPGQGGFWVNTITDGMLRAVVAGEAELKEENVKQALAKGQELVWVLPSGLAKTLDNFKEAPETKAFGQISAAALRAWKQYILINPMRVIKYNLNNMSGDLDIVLAYNPKILKGMGRALRDLRAFDKGNTKGKLKAELEAARKMGVIGSGWSVQEVEDITKQMGLDKFVRGIIMGEKPNLAVRYWEKSKGLTTLRENLLRLAAFRHFEAEIKKGKTVYGASKPVEVDAIENDTERAAKLARELVGDYGNISQSGQYLRKRMMPFWSWIEINSPRYAYMLRNVRYEGRDAGSRPLAIASKKAAFKAVGFGAKAMMLYTLVKLWNTLLFPDEEEDFGEAGRRQLHLILGRRADGTVRSIRFQGALSDTLSFFALEDFPEDIADLYKSKDKAATVLEKMIDVPKAIATRAIHALRPEPKMLFETLTKTGTYPDPFSPRPIRDTTEHILRTFSLDKIYKRAIGRPGRGKNMAEHLLNDIKSLVLYNSDPGEQAYYTARSLVFDYKEKQGEEIPSGRPNNKSNAMYYYKQALKYGDFKAAEKYLYLYYYKFGGTYQGLQSSIKHAHPLSGIKKMQRHKFRKSLSEKEADTLQRAIEWYRDTYQRESRKVNIGAMKRVRKQRLEDRLND